MLLFKALFTAIVASDCNASPSTFICPSVCLSQCWPAKAGDTRAPKHPCCNNITFVYLTNLCWKKLASYCTPGLVQDRQCKFYEKH